MRRTYLDEIHGAILYDYDRHIDDRGYFQEIYNSEKSNQCFEFSTPFGARQINLSCSKRDVVRGLHVAPYAKLVTCVRGRLFDVVADVREGSKTCGNWYGTWLTEWNKKQLMVPRGCAHGFYAESEHTTMLYAQDGNYDPDNEYEINWKDPDIGVDWPSASEYNLSDKDANAPTWKEIKNARDLENSDS